jgi:scyllo-inositol 2-dehydrogenase (NADP+)
MKVTDAEFGTETADRYGVLTLRQNSVLTSATGSGFSEETVPAVKLLLYTAYYAELARALNTGSPAPVTAEAGRDVIRLIELALESAKSGRTVVV